MIKTKGITGFVAVYGKQAEIKKSGKKVAPESDEQREQTAFLQQWFTTYQLQTENGKFSDVGRLRRWTEILAEQLEKLVAEKGEEKAQKEFLTILMAHLYLKDLKESEKSPEYSIAHYFKTLGIIYHTAYYTKTDKQEIRKKIQFRRLETAPEDLEAMVFYLTSLTKGAYNFLQQPMTNLQYPASHPVEVPICGEVTVRSMFNLILYNFAKERFDFSVLPEAVQKTINPKFKAFYEHHANPLVPHYYVNTTYEWVDFLFKDVPNIEHGRFQYDLYGTQPNLLKVCNYAFGTQAISFEELGTMLSIDTHKVVFGSDARPFIRKFNMEVTDTKNDSIIRATIQNGTDPGHVDFSLDSDSIVTLLNDLCFQVVLNLEERYQIILVPIAFTPSTVNTRDSSIKMLPVEFAGPKALKALIENGAFFEDGYLDIYDAVKKNEKDRICRLIKSGLIDVNKPNEKGNTPLYLATKLKDTETLKILLNNGAQASINVANIRGDRPLMEAISEEDKEAVELLMAYGADPSLPADNNAKSPTILNFTRNFFPEFVPLLLEKKELSLIEAIKNRYYGKIKDIVTASGVRSSDVDEKGNSALYLVAIVANEYHPEKKDIIQLLLDHGARDFINVPNKNGETLLELYMRRDDHDYEILDKLLKEGADPRMPSSTKIGKSLLECAESKARIGYLPETYELLKAAADKLDRKESEKDLSKLLNL